MTSQEQIIDDLKVSPTINPTQEITQRVQFLKDYLLAAGASSYVLGISGGQDSSLAGKLAQMAAEELRQEGKNVQFYAVRLPYGNQADEDDAQLALEFISPDHCVTFNIKEPTDALSDQFTKATGQKITDFNKGNIKARERMTAQYALAGQNNGLVVGTDHAAEAITGFFTKFGDGAADVLPLSGLNKRQGKQLLQALNAPKRLWEKTPTADLLDNKPSQADETELEVSYEEIDDFLEGKPINSQSKEKLLTKYKQSAHKRHLPPNPGETWWKN